MSQGKYFIRSTQYLLLFSCYLNCIFSKAKTLILRSTATWPLETPADEKTGWRHIKIQQTGKNASGQTHYLSLSGFEIYGTATGVCEDLGNQL